MAERSTRREVLQALALGSAGLLAGRVTAFAHQAEPDAPRRAGELLIRGGRVVNADGSRVADVRIAGERITEIGQGLRPSPGERVIEAAGRLVLPGGIDPHTHLSPPFADDLTTGSRAALAGGITSLGTFAFPGAKESLAATLARAERGVAAAAIADVFLHAAAWPLTPEVIASLASIAGQGQPSFKLFMPQDDYPAAADSVVALLEAARAAGIVTMVHCEDVTILGAAARRLAAAGHTSLAYYAESRPVVAESAATHEIVALCELTKAPVHVVHLSSARALDACRAGRRLGIPLTVETRPLYLHLTAERMAGADAPLFVGQPPLRSAADREALWAGLADGGIDILATDHAPWTRAQKLDPALSVTKLRPGMSDLQFMLPMYFSEGVGKRSLPIERFVATTSTNAARIFGLYPERGVVREGAIADVAVWDPSLARRVRAEDDHSRSDYSVYEGWEVTGWPVVTIRRGDVVYEDGKVTGAPGSGRAIRRRPWKANTPE